MSERVSDPILPEREVLPDGTRGAAERGPWVKWHVESFADKVAGLHVAAAIVLTATALFTGPMTNARGNMGYPTFAPLVGGIYLIALIAMFISRERHGLARGLLSLGAALLVVVALWFGKEAGFQRLLWAYWIPALLGFSAAIVLAWGHQMANAIEADFQLWRRQQHA